MAEVLEISRASHLEIGVLLDRRQLEISLFIPLAFAAYLRPSEAAKLVGPSLVPPNSVAGSLYTQWGLIVNSAELGVPGKTGLTDEAVVLDQQEWWPLWASLRAARADSMPLWTFTADQARVEFNDAVEFLGIPGQPSLYVLRHSGASDDLLASRRPLSDIKARGRWVTDASLRRYAKSTRLQRTINELHDSVILFGQLVEKQIVPLVERVSLGRPSELCLPVVPHAATRSKPCGPSMTTRWLSC